jgi:perosamine synthetase
VNAPVVSAEARRFVDECMRTGWLSSAGAFVERFKHAFAGRMGVRHGVAVANATAALHCALAALDLGPGDEVIVPAFTMMATIFAVLYTGATPVFVDCEIETFNLDPALLEGVVTARTRAIVAVHLFGHPCDMDAVNAVARRHGLAVVEDAAEAHGATYHGRSCGALGDVACFSFYANKIVTTGEGGMVLTSDKGLARRVRKLRDPCHSDERRFIHDDIGFNYRMTNVQAAIGCGELENLDHYVARKQAMAARYEAGLRALRGVRTPRTLPHVRNVFWMYAILVDEAQYGRSKDELRALLREDGIDTRDLFYPPGEQPVLRRRGLVRGPFPRAELAARSGCYLPSGLAITDAEIDHVVEALHRLGPR